MKYCLDFRRSTKIIVTEVDEINFVFDLASLLDFLEEYKEKRINVAIQFEDLDKIIKIYKEHNLSNIFIKLPYYEEIAAKKLKENNIPFYCATLVSDWDVFNGLIEIGVSDIFITENLGFELDKVSKIAKENKVQLRAFPNVCQSQWEYTSKLKTFFIRPDDVKIYEKYIDVFEFFGNPDRQKIYYKIYKDEQWFGSLGELILDFNFDLDSRFVIPNFAEQRVKCGKKCMKGGNCQICERIVELSKTLEKSKIIVRNNKERE